MIAAGDGYGARKALKAELKRNADSVDRTQILLALARVESALKHYDDALDVLAEAIAVPDVPWNVRLAAWVGRANLCGRTEDIACFDEALATINRELATDGRLTF